MRLRADGVIALLIFVFGVTIGAVYRKAYDDSAGAQDPPMREFGAAVAMACGHGFVNPGYLLTPALDEFLTKRRDAMSCADLPASIPPMALNVTQRLYRYLMVAAALVWRVTGVSWRGLTPLYATAYGLTLAASYGIFRLGIGRVLSTVAALALAVSAVHLQQLPFLRDYAKAPFILAAMLVMGRLAVGQWSARRALVLAAAFGAVLGIGFGFRNDLLILVVPWIVVVAFATPPPVRSAWAIKAGCVAVSAVVFVIAALPILAAYSSGSNTGHVALLGLMSNFDGPLGVAGSIYDMGYVYLDGYAAALTQSFAWRQYGQAVTYLTREYDHAAVAYVVTIARHFPADMMARAYGSIATVLELPFAAGAHVSYVPFGARGNVILRFYAAQSQALQLFNGLGVWMTGATLLAIAARSMRGAIVLLVLLVYFAGYPALQFHVRHYFHLEFIGWFALAFLIESGIAAIRARHEPWSAVRPLVTRAAAFAVVATVLLGGSLTVLRAYQSAHVRAMLRDDYLGASRVPVGVAAVPAARPGRVMLAPRTLFQSPSPPGIVRLSYLVVEYSPAGCDAVTIPSTFRYDVKDPSSDFSHDVVVRLPKGEGMTRVMTPVFEVPGWSRFAGLELPAAERGCVSGIYEVNANRIPDVLLDLNAPPHWERARLYQTLAGIESASDGEDGMPRLFSTSREQVLRVDVNPVAFAVAGPDVTDRDGIVHSGPPGLLHVAGHPQTPTSGLMVLRAQTLPAGSTVVVRGAVRRGGMALTLSRDGRVVDGVNVGVAGPFEAAVPVPAAGRYDVALENRVPRGWLEDRMPWWMLRAVRWVPYVRRDTDITITAFGWLPSSAGAVASR